MSASQRPTRVVKPSGKVLANKDPKSTSKVLKKKGGGRASGGGKGQSRARSKALADLIDISSRSSGSSSEDEETGAAAATATEGVDEDEIEPVSEDEGPSEPVWKIWCKKEKLNSTIRRYTSDLVATTHNPEM
ncbi:hypothetical protein LTR95_006994 [Oleoguttula sp. CCFEE 5521]